MNNLSSRSMLRLLSAFLLFSSLRGYCAMGPSAQNSIMQWVSCGCAPNHDTGGFQCANISVPLNCNSASDTRSTKILSQGHQYDIPGLDLPGVQQSTCKSGGWIKRDLRLSTETVHPSTARTSEALVLSFIDL
ncbi:hypothetical protein NEOLEDRAFT_1150971 [Neolentinus lepideus HHB14362 ss-1]|uniref:Uncharacterized protein n=1 Tax=Neolentinus lepideus HHB14362 ss-1 TaxID=1314782 RepID=A0A165PFT0_9AGAM|nr:hypothetical protein NEOLEDRAFT_1150971 [Neolentinus lepideus HHB14362 ss-1]